MASTTFTHIYSLQTYKSGTSVTLGVASNGDATLTDNASSVTAGTGTGLSATGAISGTSGNVTYEGAVTIGGNQYYIIEIATVGQNHKTTDSYYLVGNQAIKETNGITYSTTSHSHTATFSYTTPLTICFMPGTMIATPTGEVAVETLKAGDLVSLADGGSAAVTWLGRQTVATLFCDKLRSFPVRIKENALTDGVPARDLLLSPDHALLVDDVLTHAGALVNGVSILRETEMPDRFTYYHVEVADHSLILAENTPAETFIDNVDRMAFDNWQEHPGTDVTAEMALPRAKSARQVPPATRERLLARAGISETIAA